MKKLGLIGGIGPESTVDYYLGITRGVQRRLERQLFPSLTIESVDLFLVAKLCKEKQFDALLEYLTPAIDNLVYSGAEFLALASNTVHIILDRLKEISPVKIIGIVEATAAVAKMKGFGKLGLLGTSVTMKEDFFKVPFEERGIEIVTPTFSEMEFIDNKIFTELEVGIVRDETGKSFNEIIKRMVNNDGIEAIVLGCTELPMIINQENSPVPCLDTASIHIDAIIEEILH